MHLISPLMIAGAERVVLMLLRNIDRSKFDISVCAFLNAKKPHNAFLDAVDELETKTEVILLERKFDWAPVNRVKHILKRNSIDIIHAHGHRADVTGYLANRSNDRKLVSTMHGLAAPSPKLKLYATIDHLVLWKFDLIIAVSQHIRRILIRRGLSENRIRTVRNALDFSAYTRDVDDNLFRKELGLSKGDILIGSIARLSREKGIEYFLLAAKKILEDRTNVKFVVVGDGPDKDKLLRMRDRLRLDEHVAFVGYRTDVSSIYKAIDIFILPSLSEGLPMSLLEAAYFKRPIIATRVGGIPEFFDKRVILVNAANEEELAERTVYLLNNQAKAREYGKKVSEFVMEKCDPKKWAIRMQDIYTELMEHESDA